MTDPVEQRWPQVAFTPTERALLGYLCGVGERAVPRGELLREVWGYRPDTKTRTVRTTVNRVRQKIEDDPACPRQLLTLRGQGYKLTSPPEAAQAAAPVSREEIARRLADWLGPQQDWITVLTQAGDTRSPLPAQPTPMLGRDDLLTEALGALETAGTLLTIHGGAGLGKTRLSIAIAHRWRELGRPVWFCGLEDARDTDSALAAIADSLGIIRSPGGVGAASLATALRGNEAPLLVLDNLEQLPEPFAGALEELQAAAPSVRVASTSRRRLGLARELILAVPPLPEHTGLELLRARIEAVRFDRTQPLDDVVLAEIVDLLDGVPLALEMAAARARFVPLGELVGRLRSSFDVLGLDRDAAPDRQRTMRGAIDWSWQLLSEPQRHALHQLTVLRGGASLDLVEAVLGSGSDRFRVLGDLIDRSMLRTWTDRGAHRIGLFESVRHFVLDARGAPDPATIQRHADWALDLVQRHAPEIDREPQAIPTMLREGDNLRAAIRAMISAGDRRLFGLFESLRALHSIQAVPHDYLQLMLAARAHLQPSGREATSLHSLLGVVHHTAGEAARASVEVELGLAKASGDDPAQLELWRIRCAQLHEHGDLDEAMAVAEASLALAERLGRTGACSAALNELGGIHLHRGDRAKALACFRRGLTICESAGLGRGAAMQWENISMVLGGLGDLDGALHAANQAMAAAEPFLDPVHRLRARGTLAVTYARRGDFTKAHQLFSRILETSERSTPWAVARGTRVNAAIIALHAGFPSDAIARTPAIEDRAAVASGLGPSVSLLAVVRLVAFSLLDEVAAAERLAAMLDQAEPAKIGSYMAHEVRFARAHLHLLRSRHTQDAEEASVLRERASAVLREHGSETGDEALATALLRRHLERGPHPHP